jgi:hypothetical protein
MKKLVTIAAKVDQPHLLEDLVERLAYRHYDIGYGREKQTGEWQPVETASSEIYLSGTIEMNMSDEQLNIPYITNFLFSCIKSTDGVYRFAWGSSMS